jgi:hypothetical protein
VTLVKSCRAARLLQRIGKGSGRPEQGSASGRHYRKISSGSGRDIFGAGPVEDRATFAGTAFQANRGRSWQREIVPGGLTPADFAAVGRWIELNETVIVDYWDGSIDIAEVLQRLARLP